MSLAVIDDNTISATATCPLCWEGCETETMHTLSTCSHQSCQGCIVRWIEKTEASGPPANILPVCPFCRLPITIEELETLLCRPYKPQSANANSPTTPANQEIDELTLHWLQEQTKPCPRCGVHIEKIDGCNKMECLCGYRFCYNCGSPGATCRCSDFFHEFLDNVTGIASCRCEAQLAVADDATGHLDLLGHITRRRQQAIEEAKRREEEKIRRQANKIGIKWEDEICTTEELKRKIIWEVISLWARQCGIAEEDYAAVWGCLKRTNHDGAWQVANTIIGRRRGDCLYGCKAQARDDAKAVVRILFEKNEEDGKSPIEEVMIENKTKKAKVYLCLGVLALDRHYFLEYFYCDKYPPQWWHRKKTFLDWLLCSSSSTAKGAAKSLLGIWSQLDQPTKNLLLVHKYSLVQIASSCRAYLPHYSRGRAHVQSRITQQPKTRSATVRQNEAPPTPKEKKRTKRHLPLLVLENDMEDFYSVDSSCYDSGYSCTGNAFSDEVACESAEATASCLENDCNEIEFPALCPTTKRRTVRAFTMQYADAVRQPTAGNQPSLSGCQVRDPCVIGLSSSHVATKKEKIPDEDDLDAYFFVQLIKNTRGGKASLMYKKYRG